MQSFMNFEKEIKFTKVYGFSIFIGEIFELFFSNTTPILQVAKHLVTHFCLGKMLSLLVTS